MYLYELTKHDKFKINDPDEPELSSDWYTFDHVDGMYSVCYHQDSKFLVNLMVTTPVIKLGE